MSSLREELRQGTGKAVKASFTLAMDKARQKLEKFQLPDPRYYILQIIQAMVASGATHIEVLHRPSGLTDALATSYQLEVYFDGPGYTLDELRRLYDFLFESGRDRERDRTRELALGVVSAQALDPFEVRVTCAEGRWIRERGKKERTEELPGVNNRHCFFIHGQGGGDEVELMRSHCASCRTEIRINGRTISSPEADFSGAVPWPNYKFRKGDIHGALGLAYGDLTQSGLTLLRYGVQFARRWEPRLLPPVIFVCENPKLRKNASQSDVVEDEIYLAFVEELQQVMLDFAVGLGSQRIPSYHREVVQKFLVSFFGGWLSPSLLFSSGQDLPQEVSRLLEVQMFADVKGRMRCLREIVERYRRDGFLPLSRRRLPYARTGDALVLVPSPEEQNVLSSLFENVRFVDEGVIASLGNASAPQSTPAPSKFLAQVQLAPNHTRLEATLGIPDCFPQGECYWLVPRGENWDRGGFFLDGASAEVVFEEKVEDPALSARVLLEQSAPALYDHLLGRLLKANRKPEHMTSINRARQHLVAYWRGRLEKTLTGRHTQDSAVRVGWCRQEMGDRLWTARVFDTRSGAPASLADIETWLGTFDTVTLAYGGPKFQDDYGLDASPELAGLLGLIFGTERVQHATLRSNLLHQRQSQAALAGAADGPPLVKPVVESEEDQLARWKQEYQEAAAADEAAEAGELNPRPSAAASPPSEGATPPPEPEPLSVLLGPLASQSRSDQPPPPAVDALRSLYRNAEAAPAEKPVPAERPAPTLEEQWQELDHHPKLVSYHFNHRGLAGILAIGRPPRGVQPLPGTLLLLRGNQPLEAVSPLGLPVQGWVDITIPDGPPTPEDAGLSAPTLPRLTAVQEHTLKVQIHTIFEMLASSLAPLSPGQREFQVGRDCLLQYMLWDLVGLRGRLERHWGRDPVASCHCLPAAGSSSTSLDSLFEVVQKLGYLEVVEAGDPDPRRDYPVAVVSEAIPASFYRKVFRCDTRKARRREPLQPAEQLLHGLRKELRQMRDRGNFLLTDAMLVNVHWGEAGKYFIRYDPEMGSTVINPNHGVVKKVLKRISKDQSLVPILASSVYTAINRALEEVDDTHELAFLESLLACHPTSG